MITLKNNYITAKINELGAELKSLIYNDTQYIWEGKAEIWAGSCPLLFPICGGLKNDKYVLNGKEYTLEKHGYIRFKIFEVESKTDNSVVFLHKSDNETKEKFPFDYELRVIYTLNEKTLKIDYSVINKNDNTMYFSIGSHEGYYTPEGIEDYDVIFPQSETLNAYVLYGNLLSNQQLPIIKDQNYLPLYDKYFTVDALVFKDLKSKSATLRNRKTGKALRVDFPDDKYFLLWHKPNSPYICLEPWDGIQDIIDTSYDITEKEGIIALDGKKEYNHTHSITIIEQVTEMLENLKKLNPEVELYDVSDKEFASFGRIIKSLDATEIMETAKKIPNPEIGSSYLPSVEDFEFLKIASEIENELFGSMPTQIGYCWGHSNFLNATEWHTSSEINIAVTPLVLILGHVWDIEDGKINSSKFKAFYLPAGTVVEVYATSLHFCPCEVSKDGFGCVVGLPTGTNTDLTVKKDDPMLFRKNKWIIAHVDNEALKNRGVVAGITGTNYEIKY